MNRSAIGLGLVSRLAVSLAIMMGLLGATLSVGVTGVQAEGSANLYTGSPAPVCGPNTATTPGNCRANIEWRTSSYGPTGGTQIPRRDLFYVYLNAGETLLMGSSAVGVSNGATQGDVAVYNPGVITSYNEATLPTLVTSGAGANGFSCDAQRAVVGAPATEGQLTTRTQELAGPQAVTGGGNPTGYVPCYYTAPVSGLYNAVFTGPSGYNADADGSVGADIALTKPVDTSSAQGTSVAAWDLTVRSSTTSTTDIDGRTFLYAYDAFTAGNGLPVNSSVYVTTLDGFVYQTDFRGVDPNGFVFYGNNQGFLNPDGSILDHDVLGTTNTGQLTALAGGAKFAAPEYPISFSPLDADTLNALGITQSPVVASLSGLSFSGTSSGNTSFTGEGGTFTFTSSAAANYQIVISRDGTNFSPTLSTNRVLRGVATLGTNTVSWDGNDNSGTAFPVGTNYKVQAQVLSGEYHFPLLDAENSTLGGPTITLTNPPGGVCPFTGATSTGTNCTNAFYDDQGYHTSGSGGATVGTIGSVLCGVNPPATSLSDPNLTTGFDSASNQRAYGTTTGGNANVPCQNGGTGSFGDVKGLDLWTNDPGNTDSTPLNIIAHSSIITITKSSPTVAISSVGQVVPYSFLVTNTGDTTLSGVSVTDTQTPPSLDAQMGAITCGATTLVRQASTTCTGNYTVTAADLANGSVSDSAVANGTPPTGPAITSTPSTLSIPVAALSVVKSADPTVVSVAGSTVTYSFSVTNTGATTLDNIAVNDTQSPPSLASSLSAISCPVTTLAAGANTTCTATYTVSAADIANGTITDSATASGTPPGGTAVTSAPSSATVHVAQISVVKSSSTQDIQSVGQVVPYTFVVTNSGTTTLTDVSVDDTQSAPSLNSSLSSISCPSTTLAAGDHQTCTAEYTVTAADLANGSVNDSATATGTPPSGPDVTSPPSALSIPAATLTLAKSASPTIVSSAGSTITYTFVVTNTGGAPLGDISINDRQLAPAQDSSLSSISCPSPTLAPGDEESCTATYTVSSDDIANGTITDTATATATPPSGTPITSDPSTAVVQVAGITVQKASSTPDIQSVGQVVPYTFVVTNTGTTDLSDISVTDSQTSPSDNADLSGIDCPSATLAAGDSETCTATYTVTADDLANGAVADSATATGTPPSGPPITSGPSDYSIPAASIRIAKSADPTVVSTAGATVTYSFLVTNSGGSALSDISVSDAQAAPSDNANLSSISCPSTTLAAGDHETCTATYTVSADDVANGTITDTATATGTPPSGTPITSDPSSAVVNVAALTVVKTSTTSVITSVGQVVPYSFLVTNAGTTTLSTISVSDQQDAPADQGSLSPIVCPNDTLAAGDHETCTADYTVSAADLANGSVADSATATGTPPSGPAITSPQSDLAIPAATISVVKSADPSVVSLAGSSVIYSFLVTNTGETDLTNVSVTDTQAAPSDNANLSPINCPSATLAAGDSETCTAVYTVSAEDIANGTLNDSATATGTPPSGPPITSDPSTAVVEVAGISWSSPRRPPRSRASARSCPTRLSLPIPG